MNKHLFREWLGNTGNNPLPEPMGTDAPDAILPLLNFLIINRFVSKTNHHICIQHLCIIGNWAFLTKNTLYCADAAFDIINVLYKCVFVVCFALHTWNSAYKIIRYRSLLGGISGVIAWDNLRKMKVFWLITRIIRINIPKTALWLFIFSGTTANKDNLHMLK